MRYRESPLCLYLKILDNSLLTKQKKFDTIERSQYIVVIRGMEQLVARRAHNPKVGGSNPPPASTYEHSLTIVRLFCLVHLDDCTRT